MNKHVFIVIWAIIVGSSCASDNLVKNNSGERHATRKVETVIVDKDYKIRRSSTNEFAEYSDIDSIPTMPDGVLP